MAGTVWALPNWVGYEGMYPSPDTLGCKWFVTDVDGWFDIEDARVATIDNPAGDGTTDGPSTQPGKTLTLTGVVKAPDQITFLQCLDLASGVLVSGDRTGLLTVTEAHMTRHMTVRRAGAFKLDPQLVSGDFEAAFSLVLYASDPRRLGVELVATTFLPAATGGLTVPFTVPFTIASTVVAGQVVLTNPGTRTGPMRLRIDGPCTGPIVTHVSTGAVLKFASSYTLGTGGWLDIDMEAQTVLENGQALRDAYTTSRGWFGFDPGVNQIGFNATAYNAASKLTVYADPAW